MMKPPTSRLVCLLIVLAIAREAVTPLEAQPQPAGVVLRVGDRSVTREEFVYRLSFVPHLDAAKEDSIRIQALVASLVAEKILALEAVRSRLDTSERVRDVLVQHNGEAVYERWMQREITEKVRIAPAEIEKAYARFVEQRTVECLVFSDSTVASRAHATLGKDRDFSTYATVDGDPLFETKKLAYGEALPDVEDQIYAMSPGQVTRVIPLEGRHYIFKLTRVEPHPLYSTQSFSYWEPSVAKRLRSRKEAARLSEAAGRIMESREFRIDRNVYDFVLAEVAKRIPFGKKESSMLPEIVNQEFANTPHDISGHWHEPFLRFQNGQGWSIGDFWKKLRNGPYPLNYRSEQDLTSGFSHLIRTMVIFETIVEDGRRQGLDRDAYVVEQTRMWNDDLLSKLYQRQIMEESKTQAEQGTDGPGTGREALSRMNAALAQGSKKYAITIHKDAVKHVQVPKQNMLVRKSHFPNRVAVPFSTPIDPAASWFQRLWNAQ
jgi:hypothetical protein